MNNKQYELNGVTYGYSLQSKKWEFKFGKFTYLANAKGTTPSARQTIAKLVRAGYIRSGENGLDGLARSNINKVLTSAVK